MATSSRPSPSTSPKAMSVANSVPCQSSPTARRSTKVEMGGSAVASPRAGAAASSNRPSSSVHRASERRVIESMSSSLLVRNSPRRCDRCHHCSIVREFGPAISPSFVPYFKYFSNHPNIYSNRATRRSVRPPRLTPWDSPGSSSSSVSTPSRRRAMNTCSPCSWSQR